MTLLQSIKDAITPAIDAAGYFLEDLHIASPGNRRVVTVVVDGSVNLNLDEVTALTKAISAVLDDFMDESPFTLEVSSPGVDRPLTLPRHWQKNVTRLVRSVMVNGEEIIGRVDAVHDESVCVIVGGAHRVELPFVEIKRAQVEIEFNRKDENLS
jgi:ribosome maturation factor RimP